MAVALSDSQTDESTEERTASAVISSNGNRRQNSLCFDFSNRPHFLGVKTPDEAAARTWRECLTIYYKIFWAFHFPLKRNADRRWIIDCPEAELWESFHNLSQLVDYYETRLVRNPNAPADWQSFPIWDSRLENYRE